MESRLCRRQVHRHINLFSTFHHTKLICQVNLNCHCITTRLIGRGETNRIILFVGTVSLRTRPVVIHLGTINEFLLHVGHIHTCLQHNIISFAYSHIR